MQRSIGVSASRQRPASIAYKHERVRSTDLEGASSKKRRAGTETHRDGSWLFQLLAVIAGWLMVNYLTDIASSLAPLPVSPVIRPPVSMAQRDVIEVDVRDSAQTSAGRADERYLAYFPHSGYHNQRISLENALTLAFMLNRTLLVPPARLGNAIPYISFDKLYLRTNQATKVGLDHCKRATRILPAECIGYFDWTQVSWDFLVDFKSAQELVPVIDRWNGTYEWLEENLNITEEDTFSIPDDRMYQFRLYDSRDDDAPLAKFEKRIDVHTLSHFDDYKLIHLGTLFGTSRIRTTKDVNGDARSHFRQSMVFRNPLVDRITDAIRHRLGGESGYFSLHLRVGDGLFLKHARQNAREVLRRLMITKMHLDESVTDELLVASELQQGLGPSNHSREKQNQESVDQEATPSRDVNKRSNSRPQSENAYHHAPLPALPHIRNRADSPLAPSLTCRRAFYTDERFLKLNAPVFLATDSRQPITDPHLALLFDVLPCLFVLGDFAVRTPTGVNSEPIAELAELDKLVNADDGVALAQFLYPIIDMVTAAKGRAIVGTASSTFSRFAVDVLHQVYHGWDIIERG